MQRPKTPFRIAMDEFRTAGLKVVSAEFWADAVRLTPAQLRRASVEPLARLVRHRDVVVVRLLDLQPTLVHRDHWADLLAVATSGAPWQMKWLPPEEARLLEVVDAEGFVRLDNDLAFRLDAAPKNLGRTLMSRLLVLGSLEPLAKRGTVRTLVSWWRWAEENRVGPTVDESVAMARLEAMADGWRLPWYDRPLRHRWGW